MLHAAIKFLSVKDTVNGIVIVAIDKITRGIAGYINRSERAQGVLRGVSKNPALGGAASSFILSTTLRPAAVLAVTPDKDDAKFAACSSISSAFVELIGSYTIFKPMNRIIENSAKQLYDLEGSIYYKNPLLLRKYKSLTNRITKLPLTFVIAMIRFSLIYPLTLLLGRMGIVKKTERGQVDEDK